MSDVVRDRFGWTSWPSSADIVGGMANAAASVETAVRSAVDSKSARAATGFVKEHTLLTALLAVGVGYLIGREWTRSARPESLPQRVRSSAVRAFKR